MKPFSMNFHHRAYQATLGNCGRGKSKKRSMMQKSEKVGQCNSLSLGAEMISSMEGFVHKTDDLSTLVGQHATPLWPGPKQRKCEMLA